MSETIKDSVLKEFSLIAQEIERLQNEREKKLIETKGRFNVFTTLLAIGDETRLHSRFIAHLLNPKANHDCGSLFLDLFLDVICEKNTELRDVISEIKGSECLEARTEKSTDGKRRIDIYLQFNKFKIAIENKIWAGEQGDQIADYATFISSDKINNFLFYLTLDGKESQTAAGRDYFRISYAEHINAWLKKSLKALEAQPNICHVVKQYHNVVKKLTGRTMEDEDMDKIVDLLNDHLDVISNQNKINRAIEIFRARFFDEFKEKFKEKNIEYKYDSDRGGPFFDISNPEGQAYIIRLRLDNVSEFIHLGMLARNEIEDDLIYKKLIDESVFSPEKSESGQGWSICHPFNWVAKYDRNEKDQDIYDFIIEKIIKIFEVLRITE